MKLKVGFSLAIILIVLMSVSVVSADENGTSDNSVLATGEDSPEVDASGNGGDDSPEVDATANGEGDSAKLVLTSEPSKNSLSYGDNVDFEITVRSVGGVSKDTAVTIYYGGLEYVSHRLDKGSYNPHDGEWKVGNLADGEVAHMLITLKSISYGDPDFHVYAHSESVTALSEDNYVFTMLHIYNPSYTVTGHDDPKIHHKKHHVFTDYSDFRSVTKSVDVPDVEAKTTKEPVNNSTVPQDENPVSQMETQNDYGYLPWIIVLVVLAAAAGIVYRKYS